MVKHYNPSISARAARLLNSKGVEFLPDDVSGPVAVIDINKPKMIVFATSSASSGAGTILTFPSDKDVFIDCIVLSSAQDASCDNVSTRLTGTAEDGAATVLADLSFVVLSAQNQAVTINYPYLGLKMKRGSTISVTKSFTVGTFRYSVVIYYHTEETLSAQ